MSAAVYLRVSTDEQRERQTIAGQRQYAEVYLQQNGLAPLWYEDDGVSGTVPVEKRPGGSRLLEDAGSGRFKLLLVYRVDRLARSLLELLRCVETLDAHGVALRSMSEPFDTGSALGRAFLQLLGIFAELERNAIRERSALGKARRAAEGAWMGGTVPFGYRVVAGRYVEEPYEAEIVRELFRLCIEGSTTATTAALMNARGVPNPRKLRGSSHTHSGRWNHTTVGSILRNPAYYGSGRFRHGEVTVPFPSLIDEETWNAARDRRQQRRRRTGSGERIYWLTGLLRCDLCGASASGCRVKSAPAGTVFSYYRCSRDPRFGVSCRAPHVRAEWLEEEVWRECQRPLLEPELVLERLETLLRTQQAAAPPTDKLAELGRIEGEKAQERARVISLVRRGLVSDDEAASELSILRIELEAVQGRAAQLRDQQLSEPQVNNRLQAAAALLQRLEGFAKTEDPAGRRIVASELLSEVRMGKSGSERYYRLQWSDALTI